MRNLLLGIVGLEALALGIKAYDDWQTSAAQAAAGQDANTAALAASVLSRAELARSAIEVSALAGASRELAVQTVDGIDLITTLADAAQSGDPRLVSATRTATRLLAAGDTLGVSGEGDMIVAMDVSGAGTYLALGPASEWLPVASATQRLSLVGDTDVATGNASLLRVGAIDAPGARINIAEMQRVLSTCTPLPDAQATVCTVESLPLFETADLARMAFYLFLVLGPALALFGLSAEAERQGRARMRAEDELARGGSLISMVMRSAEAGNWEWIEGTESIAVSETCAALLGAKPIDGAITGRQLVECIHPGDAEALTRAMRESRDTGQISVAFRVRDGDGRRWLEMRGQRVESDGKAKGTRFVGIVIDVTDRKMAEERLRWVEQKMRVAIEGYSGPFALWDKRQRLVLWNSAFVADFGLQDVVREGISYESIDLARRAALRHDRDAQDDRRAREVRLRDGRWLKVVERPTPEGGMITVGVDITANIQNAERLVQQTERQRKTMIELDHMQARNAELLRKYEEEKNRAEQASKTKSAFLANVSHELRTPLNAINGFSEMLVHEVYGPLGDSRYVSYSKDILNSGKHLLEMINDILDMAKIEAGKMSISTRPIDPVDPVDAAIRMLRHRAEDKNIRLSLEHEDVPMIEADHRAMRQIAINLIGNAIKFTPEGGRVAISITRKGEYCRICVRDSGIGIAKEDLPRLGRPFEQISNSADRTYEGTGLGLALTKSFAEMHGGRLSIASEPGKGTLVAVYIPFAQANRVAEYESAEAIVTETLAQDDSDAA